MSSTLRVSGVTGPLVIDYKGDRIMDYQVWYLASDSDKFSGYMKIPLTKAGRNTTACVEWLVRPRILVSLTAVFYARNLTACCGNSYGNSSRVRGLGDGSMATGSFRG